MKSKCTWLLALLVASICSISQAQQKFSELVGNVPVKPVAKSDTVVVPYITWGGDVATFHANGGLTTQAGSIYGKSQLNVKLSAGDDFVNQVKDYVGGKSPFLRGTFRMLGQASEVVGDDPRTKPVIILQLSWSAGDHIVSRESIKTLNDLKGKKIACQQGGPHVGLLYDSLAAAKLTNSDVEIVWTTELTGPDGAAELFRSDSSIDACCVITPDMLGLTGGIEIAGSGAEGTVEGAHVVNSTQSMSRSIADVYAVRRDWYDANKDWVKKFVAGYLQSTLQVAKMRNDFETSQRLGNDYRTVLAMSQKIFGEEVLPTLEVDAHGLLLDCEFTGPTGQVEFFKKQGNFSGFNETMKKSLDLATKWGYAGSRKGFDPNDFSYQELAKLGGYEYKEPTSKKRFGNDDAEGIGVIGELDDNTIVSFTINFDVNQAEFSTDRYGSEFERAIRAASTFGNARVVIRGHADPTKALIEMVKAGLTSGVMKRTGTKGNFRYFFEGRPIKLEDTTTILQMIETGKFSNDRDADPRGTAQAALNLSNKRAQAVKEAVVEYAKEISTTIDLSQIVPVGAGISDPVVPVPQTTDDQAENRRVEFRIVRVDAESVSPTDFDL